MAKDRGRGVEDGVGGNPRVGDNLPELDEVFDSFGFFDESQPATTPSYVPADIINREGNIKIVEEKGKGLVSILLCPKLQCTV